MSTARELWERLSAAFEQQDTEVLDELYASDAVFLEPQNPPHETDKLIQAYLNSWLQAREDLSITTKRLLESADGASVAVEWSLSYTAGGRRWKDLPRASWMEASGGAIRYHRDYF